jgi:23S rRNA pseudoU1915 N3-methylase RlmH
MREKVKRFRAYVEIEGKKIIVFPRSKKRSLMTIAEAEAKFESVGKRLNKNARGVVVDHDGKIIFSMSI